MLIPFRSDYFEGIRMHGLPNAGHGELHNDVLEEAKATPAIVQNLSGPLAEYEAAVEKETEASFKDMTDSITEKINKELVPKRNSVETGFKAGVRAQEESDDQTVVKSAKMLTELAHLHHMHTDLKVNSQTDAIRDFVADVETNHMEALNLVGATQLFNKLKAANDEVCQAIKERTRKDAERVIGVMAEARVRTDNAYRGLTHCVTAFVYIQGLEPYNSFIRFTNQLVKDYRRTYFGITSSGSDSAGGEGDEGTGGEQGGEGGEGGATGGEGGATGGGQGGEQGTPTLFTVKWYGPNNELLYTQQYEAGAHIVPPEPPAGYIWNYHPNYMPAENLTVDCLLDE